MTPEEIKRKKISLSNAILEMAEIDTLPDFSRERLLDYGSGFILCLMWALDVAEQYQDKDCKGEDQ